MVPESSFPVFTITNILEYDNLSRLQGTLNTRFFRDQEWVADSRAGCILLDESVVFGKWKLNNQDIYFILDDISALPINFYLGQSLPVLDSYWGERAKIVFDKELDWVSKVYDKSDDHDHCGICWATISADDKCMGAGKIFLCIECYERYLQKRSLGFITD